MSIDTPGIVTLVELHKKLVSHGIEVRTTLHFRICNILVYLVPNLNLCLISICGGVKYGPMI